MTSRTICLTNELNTTHFSGCRPNYIAWIIVNYGQNLTMKFRSYFLLRRIRVRLPSWFTFVISIRFTPFFSKALLCLQIATQTLRNHCIWFSVWLSKSTAPRVKTSREVNCVMALLSSQKVCDWYKIEFHNRQNLQQSTSAKLFKIVTINSLHFLHNYGWIIYIVTVVFCLDR